MRSADALCDRFLSLLREARSTRWTSDRECFLALRDRSANAVTPASLVRAFKDYFAVVLDDAHARHLAYALGGDDERRHVSYVRFAETVGSESYFDARRWRVDDGLDEPPSAGLEGGASPKQVAFNPIVSPPLGPLDALPFDAESADDAFRNALLLKHESIAESWLALNAARDGKLSLGEMAAGLRLHVDGELTDDECRRGVPGRVSRDADRENDEHAVALRRCRRVFALYNARTDGPLQYNDFARRFAKDAIRIPLSSPARAQVVRRAAAGIPCSPIAVDEAYLGGWFAHEPPTRSGPSWREAAGF